MGKQKTQIKFVVIGQVDEVQQPAFTSIPKEAEVLTFAPAQVKCA
jgi:hypothetical protein